MSALSRAPCAYVNEVSVILPGRSSDTRLEFGIPVIRENTVDWLCLESANYRECGHNVGAGFGTQSDTAEVRSPSTPENASYYSDHIGQTSKKHAGRSANHAQVAHKPYRGVLPPHIAAYIKTTRKPDKNLCFSGLQYYTLPQVNTADLAVLPLEEGKAPGTADLAAPPSAERKVPGTADLATPPSSERQAPGTADLATPPSSERQAPGTADLARPPSAERKAPGTAELAAPPSTEGKVPGTADLSTPPSAEREVPGTADLASPPSAERQAPGTADLARPPSAERKVPNAANLAAPTSAERKAPETVKRQCDISCSTEVEIKPRGHCAFRSARNNMRTQPTKTHHKHVQTRAERTDFRRCTSEHR